MPPKEREAYEAETARRTEARKQLQTELEAKGDDTFDPLAGLIG